jgi:uncharacterized protein (TIGR02145 family)
MTIRFGTVAIALGLACTPPVLTALQDAKVSAVVYAPKQMPDGKQWTTINLNVSTELSSCYDDAEQNCRRYGRLYTWQDAQRVCGLLGAGWRLPTSEEWRQLGMHFGGIRQESADLGKAAFTALMPGGRSGFNAVLGGGRNAKDKQYARIDAHGLYWTSSESGPDHAWFYNFGSGAQSFGRHEHGEKLGAFAVRCVRDPVV